jgi:hypothetical protein
LASAPGDAARTVWREVAPRLSQRDGVEWTVDVDPINLR